MFRENWSIPVNSGQLGIACLSKTGQFRSIPVTSENGGGCRVQAKISRARTNPDIFGHGMIQGACGGGHEFDCHSER